MSILDNFLDNIYQFLISKTPPQDANLIKCHSKNLDQLGDVSFPILLKNWSKLINSKDCKDTGSIFKYKFGNINDMEGLLQLQKDLNHSIKIQRFELIHNNAHLFLDRSLLIKSVIRQTLTENVSYGKCKLFNKQINCLYRKDFNNNRNNIDLTTLRLFIIKEVAENLIRLNSNVKELDSYNVYFDDSHIKFSDSVTIICSPVINEKGAKNIDITAGELINKRSSNIKTIALHRNRNEINSTEYFSKLGMSSIILELLSTKLSKSIKMTLSNDRTNAEKDASFICYNCARLSVLINEFNRRVQNKIYTDLPELKTIDFSLLKQPEEWKLVYIFIAQYTSVVRNSIKNIEHGIINPQNLVTFLLNLSLTFSGYYRRIKILIESKEHLLGLLHARIYLLMALQCVFHNALRILNIEPIQEM